MPVYYILLYAVMPRCVKGWTNGQGCGKIVFVAPDCGNVFSDSLAWGAIKIPVETGHQRTVRLRISLTVPLIRKGEKMDRNNIIFIGMPAVGKSTIGVIVAKRLGYRFIDTDILIQEEEGKLLKEIIKEKGIDGFLEVEDRINARVQTKRTVISPGGSVIYCENAMKHYKEIGRIVYLKAAFETISKRIHNARGRGVVLRDGQSLRELYDERTALFKEYADVTVCEDGLKLEDTIRKVLEKLGAE